MCFALVLLSLVASLGLALPAFATSTYLYDDGGAEFRLGVNAIGQGLIAVNQFVVDADLSRITAVEAAWDQVNGPVEVTAAVWSDPDQDGKPADAVLLGTSDPQTVSTPGFKTFPLPGGVDVGPNGTSFFVGVYYVNTAFAYVGVDFSYSGPNVTWQAIVPGGAQDPNDLSNLSPRATHNIEMVPMVRACAVMTVPVDEGSWGG